MPTLKNPKHEVFAQELAKGKSAGEAYSNAGYSPNRGNAATLKRDQSILARVEELLAERERMHSQATTKAIEKLSLTKEWVLSKLVENAERALQDRPVLNSDGEPVGEYRYEGSVANRSLELLGKELGMFIDRREVGKPGEFFHMSEDELDAFIAGEKEALGGGLGGEGKASGQTGMRGKSSGIH